MKLTDRKTWFSALLGGVYIGLACIGMVMVKSDASLSPAISNLLSGLIFSIGLFAVCQCNGSLFTGSCLFYTSVLEDESRLGTFIKTLVINYLANFIGIAAVALLARVGNIVSQDIVNTIAIAKFSKSSVELLVSGAFCNILVCAATLMTWRSKSIVDGFFAVLLPVIAFVACGFEHSIADMFFFVLNTEGLSSSQLWLGLFDISFGNLLGGISYAIALDKTANKR